MSTRFLVMLVMPSLASLVSAMRAVVDAEYFAQRRH